MSDPVFDVIGVGNAIVDVLSPTEDAFLAEHGLDKGMMTLIDTSRARSLYDAMGPGVEVSGGSAANTIAGIASLGGAPAYIGKVRNDQLGGVFAHDIRAAGVDFRTPPATEGAPTARCLIFVTPDAQRTMQTYLGVSVELGPDEIDETAVTDAGITYLEGYLFDPPEAKKAFVKAAEVAHRANRKVALTLSDPFCVDRHRAEFLHLISGHVDILFANEAEIIALFEVGDFDEALGQVRGHCEIAALTRSEKGSVIVAGDEVHVVDARPVERVVDTTGAGDLYAAGVLYGLSRQRSLADCARIGGLAAAEVIGHYGARPETRLDALLAESGI
ncbi:MAG: adenosine kinase [Alphaproteobacteria bacterium]